MRSRRTPDAMSSTKEAPARSRWASTSSAGPERLARRRGGQRARLRPRVEQPAEVAPQQQGQRHGGGEPSARVARALVQAEPAPRDLAGEAELVEPAGLVAARCARAGSRAPTRPPRPRSPGAARSRAAGRRARAAGCRGATCCHEKRKRSKRRGRHRLDERGAGRRACGDGCARAGAGRTIRSSPPAMRPGVKRPRSTPPSASTAASAASTSPG